MTIFRIFALFFALTLISACSTNKKPPDISSNKVVPSTQQILYQQMEMVGFIHFSINTFTNKEWGYGDEDEQLFNPTELDVDQWVQVAKSCGIKELILTAKHHDGFCLWPSQYTDHSIKNSGYKNGNGDVVKEFVDACRKHDLKIGLYLSPWDRNHKDYGNQTYITYYRNQLKELLTQYGEINEIWFDGANGGNGFYGGANETRKIDNKTYYDWDGTIKLVKELQPNILIFSDSGPDIRWVGNENGSAGETFWSTINRNKIRTGAADVNYLNTGESEGSNWIVGQCDVSIRPGWFYHEAEDTLVKSSQELVDIYYKSVGRNAVFLLNLPPDKTGNIQSNDVKAIQEFKKIIDDTFKVNLASNAECNADNFRLTNEKFAPKNALDEDPETYWATDDSISSAELIIDLKNKTDFDRILIQEPIKFGQRISKFEVQVYNQNNWETVFEGTTIGYKRLIRIKPVTVSKIKLKIIEANNIPAISNFSLFKSSEKETASF
ncbi:MAG: alpha-L-fucosidase [Bacteroidetes bacterium]|nr:alpha-L-fucosidase [Bacteroidota bacterium]